MPVNAGAHAHMPAIAHGASNVANLLRYHAVNTPASSGAKVRSFMTSVCFHLVQPRLTCMPVDLQLRRPALSERGVVEAHVRLTRRAKYGMLHAVHMRPLDLTRGDM